MDNTKEIIKTNNSKGIKFVNVAFSVDLAKKITSGEIDGKIIRKGGDGEEVRIICFDKKGKAPIVVLFQYKDCEWEHEECYRIDGYNENEQQETWLELEIPEYLMFNEGDVISYDDAPNIIAIYNKYFDKETFIRHAILVNDELMISENNGAVFSGIRLATCHEKEKMKKALLESKDPEAKKLLEKFFIDYSVINFSFKQQVLVRNSENLEWDIAEFSFKDSYNNYHVFGGNFYKQCIPYEGNENLLGKINYE